MSTKLLVCPSCRASNPPSAEWCNQCFHSFAEAGEEFDQAIRGPEQQEPAGTTGEAQAVESDDGLEQALAEVTRSLAGDEPADADEGEDDDDRTWECTTCDAPNPVASSACRVCGTSIYDSFGAHEEQAVVDPEKALRRALVFPGLGHSVFGHGGIAFVTAFLAVVSALSGLMLLVVGELSGLVLMIVVAAVWAFSVYDVMRLAQGVSAPMLRPRVLSIFGGIVILVILVTMAAAFASNTGSAVTD